MAGLASDANVLVQYIRSFAQQHRFTYQEAIPVEQLVIRLCDVTHWQTFAGGQRPFGVSFLFGGWDSNYGYQLYHAMPNGNYIGWSAIAIGNNHQMAQDVLKKEYKPEETPDVQGGLKLCAKVLGQALDATKGSADVMEFSVLRRDAAGSTSHTVLSAEECEALLKTVESESASKSDE